MNQVQSDPFEERILIDQYRELAKSIRSNAKRFLEAKKIELKMREIGELYFTGSYALDLMTWNDIDMQIVLKEGVDPLETLSNLFQLFAKDPGFIEAQITHFQGNFKPKMPRGIYLGIKMNDPDLGEVWKLDIWSLAKPDFEKNRSLIETLSAKLNSKKRDLILKFKHEMMAANGRVPQMGSHFLYQAVLFEGILEKEVLYQYLATKGIPIK